MKRSKRIFTVIYDKVEPSEYIKGIMLRCNRNIIQDREMFFDISKKEIKDLCIYHNDPYVMQYKSVGTASRWIELYKEYC